MQKILYILLPCLLALATPSFSSTRKKFRQRQRYEQYQQPTHNQSLETKESKSSNTILKSTGVYFIIGLVSVVATILFFLFDFSVLEARFFTFAGTRMRFTTIPSFGKALWGLIQFFVLLISPGFVIGGLISIPAIYFIYDNSNDSDDNFNDEERSRYSNKRRPPYR